MESSIKIVGMVVALLVGPVLGDAVLFMEPVGGTGNEITVSAGGSVTIEVYAQDVSPLALSAYELTLPEFATPGALATGSVEHDDNVPIIDTGRTDWPFFGITAPIMSTYITPFGEPGMVVFYISAPPEGYPSFTEKKYLGEFTYSVAASTVGVFTIDFQRPWPEPAANTALTDPNSQGIPATYEGAIIRVVCQDSADCDDGLYCNGEEACVAGECVAGTPPCPLPGLPYCDDGLDQCTECLVGSDCNDGNECTSNQCSSGTCSNPARPPGTACGDATNTDCTNPDTCDGASGCLDNHAIDGAGCDDGEYCTVGETCTAGVCGDSAPKDCADAFSCTQDTCNEDGDQCEHDLMASNCLIEGACYVEGEFNPTNECEKCNALETTWSWSFVLDGTSCIDEGNDCTDDICEAGVCTHPDLPGGTECDDGNPCTGTGAPGVGVDTCDGAGSCAGVLDPDCADNCANAVEAFEGTNTGTNVGFGPDEAEASCQPNSNHDAWFFYTALCDGDVRMTTDGSLFVPSNDTVASVLDACGGNEIACDDDSGSELLSALVVFNAIANATYHIRVAGFGDNAGDIMLNINRLDTCLIAEQCIPEGTTNPANECQICQPTVSNTEWSPKPIGTACGDSGFGECDSPDACNAVGECEANHKPDSTPCTEDGNECTDDICLAGVCSNPYEPPGLSCGDPTDTDCDNPDTCDGAGACLDNLEPVGFACGDPTDTDCDNPDTCDGADLCLQNLEPDDTVCTDDGNDCTYDFCTAGVCGHHDKEVGAACGDPTDTQCDNPDTCDGFGFCEDNLELDGTLCDDENICTGPDLCLSGMCDTPFIPEAPIVETGGPRALLVTPQPAGSTIPQALLVTSPDYPCVAKYIDATGYLGDTPVYQSPIDWGTILVLGSELMPLSTYNVAAECGGDLSDIGTGMTGLWGDPDVNGTINLFDLFCMLDGFRGSFPNCLLENVDMAPCTPDGVINVFDMFQVLNAFAGDPFPCAGPCGDGACCEGDICTLTDDAAECQSLGGEYQGNGADCLPNPCLGSPSPNSVEDPDSAGTAATQATIRIVPRRNSVRAGMLFTVDLLVSSLADLKAYEVSVETTSGRAGSIDPEAIFIDTERSDYVFGGIQSFHVADNSNHRMMNGVMEGSATTTGETYLGSFELRVSRNARGSFEINVGTDHGPYLLDSAGRVINLQLVGATVSVGPDASDAEAIRRRR